MALLCHGPRILETVQVFHTCRHRHGTHFDSFDMWVTRFHLISIKYNVIQSNFLCLCLRILCVCARCRFFCSTPSPVSLFAKVGWSPRLWWSRREGASNKIDQAWCRQDVYQCISIELVWSCSVQKAIWKFSFWFSRFVEDAIWHMPWRNWSRALSNFLSPFLTAVWGAKSNGRPSPTLHRSWRLDKSLSRVKIQNWLKPRRNVFCVPLELLILGPQLLGGSPTDLGRRQVGSGGYGRRW